MLFQSLNLMGGSIFQKQGIIKKHDFIFTWPELTLFRPTF